MIDTDKYEGLIDAEGYIDYDGLDHLLAEVKRLRKMEKFYMSQWHSAVQVMQNAVRCTLDSFSTCPSCDELPEIFVDHIPEGLRSKMLLQRQDPESFWYKGDKND